MASTFIKSSIKINPIVSLIDYPSNFLMFFITKNAMTTDGDAL